MKPDPQGGAGCAPIPETIVVGIDVGGPRKGFHAVALRDGVYLDKFASPDPLALAAWCIQVGARAVAIDAPCRWSRTGRARPAERAWETVASCGCGVGLAWAAYGDMSETPAWRRIGAY